MALVTLVVGGARSGKSAYALALAETISPRRYFIATCPVTDEEMRQRIERHRVERAGRGWQCCEEETAIADLIGAIDAEGVILIDCLTLWINNLLFRAEGSNEIFTDAELRKETERLLAAARKYQGTVVLVSNEVGMGIVPDNALARLYRDLVGTCNRLIAAAADEVVLVSCGLPLFLKNGQSAGNTFISKTG